MDSADGQLVDYPVKRPVRGINEPRELVTVPATKLKTPIANASEKSNPMQPVIPNKLNEMAE